MPRTTKPATPLYAYSPTGVLTDFTQTGGAQAQWHATLDALNRIQAETYTYTPDGQKNSITYPDQSQLTYTYNQGLLQDITLPNGQKLTWGGYQNRRPGTISTPGLTKNLIYDDIMSPQSIRAGTQFQRDYTYDALGNLTQMQTEAGTLTYQYDKLDHLTQVSPDAVLQ